MKFTMRALIKVVAAILTIPNRPVFGPPRAGLFMPAALSSCSGVITALTCIRTTARHCAMWSSVGGKRGLSDGAGHVSPEKIMDIDFSMLTEYQRYKLMASLIVLRPIALVTTVGSNGVVNAAPFSMFNMLGEEPPILICC